MTTRLLSLGMAAGPVYIALGILQTVIREGFDPRLHPLSILANGELGWIQTGNFWISGALVLAGAVGCRQAIRSERAGTWGPILLGLYGVGLLGAGVFAADPAQGFPPGAEIRNELSRSGLLHFAFGGLGFYALIAACFVFARRFLKAAQPGMGWYSIVTGVGFFISFAAIASGSTTPLTMLSFYAAITWAWVWHTILLLRFKESAS